MANRWQIRFRSEYLESSSSTEIETRTEPYPESIATSGDTDYFGPEPSSWFEVSEQATFGRAPDYLFDYGDGTFVGYVFCDLRAVDELGSVVENTVFPTVISSDSGMSSMVSLAALGLDYPESMFMVQMSSDTTDTISIETETATSAISLSLYGHEVSPPEVYTWRMRLWPGEVDYSDIESPVWTDKPAHTQAEVNGEVLSGSVPTEWFDPNGATISQYVRRNFDRNEVYFQIQALDEELIPVVDAALPSNFSDGIYNALQVLFSYGIATTYGGPAEINGKLYWYTLEQIEFDGRTLDTNTINLSTTNVSESSLTVDSKAIQQLIPENYLSITLDADQPYPPTSSKLTVTATISVLAEQVLAEDFNVTVAGTTLNIEKAYCPTVYVHNAGSRAYIQKGITLPAGEHVISLTIVGAPLSVGSVSVLEGALSLVSGLVGPKEDLVEDLNVLSTIRLGCRLDYAASQTDSDAVEQNWSHKNLAIFGYTKKFLRFGKHVFPTPSESNYPRNAPSTYDESFNPSYDYLEYNWALEEFAMANTSVGSSRVGAFSEKWSTRLRIELIARHYVRATSISSWWTVGSKEVFVVSDPYDMVTIEEDGDLTILLDPVHFSPREEFRILLGVTDRLWGTTHVFPLVFRGRQEQYALMRNTNADYDKFLYPDNYLYQPLDANRNAYTANVYQVDGSGGIGNVDRLFGIASGPSTMTIPGPWLVSVGVDSENLVEAADSFAEMSVYFNYSPTRLYRMSVTSEIVGAMSGSYSTSDTAVDLSPDDLAEFPVIQGPYPREGWWNDDLSAGSGLDENPVTPTSGVGPYFGVTDTWGSYSYTVDRTQFVLSEKHVPTEELASLVAVTFLTTQDGGNWEVFRAQLKTASELASSFLNSNAILEQDAIICSYTASGTHDFGWVMEGESVEAGPFDPSVLAVPSGVLTSSIDEGYSLTCTSAVTENTILQAAQLSRQLDGALYEEHGMNCTVYYRLANGVQIPAYEELTESCYNLSHDFGDRSKAFDEYFANNYEYTRKITWELHHGPKTEMVSGSMTEGMANYTLNDWWVYNFLAVVLGADYRNNPARLVPNTGSRGGGFVETDQCKSGYTLASQFSLYRIKYMGLWSVGDLDGYAPMISNIKRQWFCGVHLGKIYVAIEFENGEVYHYWLREPDLWTPDTAYEDQAVVRATDDPENPAFGWYYRAKPTEQPPAWSPFAPREVGDKVQPTVYDGFKYEVIEVEGETPCSGEVEPDWNAERGAETVELADGPTPQSPSSPPPTPPAPNPGGSGRYSGGAGGGPAGLLPYQAR